ncbi:MAG: hypothetical protein JNM19_17815 [Chitinophagaceae bacterium]|nr:hypothetical protein [Chitinophagaceae bacterium]
MFTMQHFGLGDINAGNTSLQQLYEIFKCTLNPDLTEDEFNSYLFGQHPESLEISYIYKDKELAGFCTGTAYPLTISKKRITVLRSAFGLREDYREGNFPLQGLFFKYIRRKLKAPFSPMYVAGFMANPLMYAMICRYSLNCYPRPGKKIPAAIFALKHELTRSLPPQSTGSHPFVMRIHFQVALLKSDISRIHQSKDPYVKYFTEINPHYQQQHGVLVLVPVSWLNILYTTARYLFRRLKKMASQQKSRKINKPCPVPQN